MKKKNIKIPFPNTPPKDIQYKFAFKAPSSVNLVGSYLLKTSCKTPTINNIDLAVEMPKVYIYIIGKIIILRNHILKIKNEYH